MPATTHSSTQFSILLFIDGLPVRYELQLQDDTVLLLPDLLLSVNETLPQIEATRSDSGWTFPPSVDSDLAAQVLEDLERLVRA